MESRDHCLRHQGGVSGILGRPRSILPQIMTTSKKTNIIFILADDLGYADLGCYGGRAPVSPHIDRLAAQGLRFTRGYSNSPVCSPTRFALMTGRYQYHFRGAAEEPLHGASAGLPSHGLSPHLSTLPRLLQQQGYRTGLVGKWHLGNPPHSGPLLCGYDEHFGMMAGGVDYFTHTNPGGRKDLWHNGEPVEDDTYLTDLLTDRAVDFIERCARDDTPFLLSLHYTAPHWPWETRQDRELAQSLVGKIFHLDGGSVETYQTMIHHMDEGIGRLMDQLERLGLADDTLIVFTSDNGGERFSDNWPLSGGKMDLTEGGIRVPYVVRWPARVPAGRTSEQQLITMDWVPTLLQAAGVDMADQPEFDGICLIPCLEDPDRITQRTLFWRMNHRGQKAAIRGDWKFLEVDGHPYLFNISRDARERANQIHREPALFHDLSKAWTDWAGGIPQIPPDARVTLVYTKQDMP
jgi:arylsulfatase A-like enzyme